MAELFGQPGDLLLVELERFAGIAYRRTPAVADDLVDQRGTVPPAEIPLDQDLLLRVANDPRSPSYTDTQPTGLTIITPNSAQLLTAFEQVANEIFRLIQ